MKTEDLEVSVTLSLAPQLWHRRLSSSTDKTLMVELLDLTCPARESQASAEEVAVLEADVAVAASEIVTVVVVVDSEADVASATVVAEAVDSAEEAAALVIVIVEAVALETEAASEAVEETVVGSGNLTESSLN